MDTDTRVARLAARQHGVVARAQARAAGLTPRMIQRRLERGLLVVVHPGVYVVAGAPTTWHQRLLAVCLALGAVASHWAAAALWRLTDAEFPPVEVTVAGLGGRPFAGGRLHRTRSLPPTDQTERDGVPVTRPARTLVDLAAVASPSAMEVALDTALRDGLVSVPSVARRLAALGPRGRAGAAVLGDLLADRGREAPAGSGRELRLARMLVAAGLPRPVRQFELRGGGRVVARFDLAWPGDRVAVEFQSYRHHSGRQAWRRDQVRTNAANAAGWRVLAATANELGDGAAVFCATVAAALGRSEAAGLPHG